LIPRGDEVRPERGTRRGEPDVPAKIKRGLIRTAPRFGAKEKTGKSWKNPNSRTAASFFSLQPAKTFGPCTRRVRDDEGARRMSAIVDKAKNLLETVLPIGRNPNDDRIPGANFDPSYEEAAKLVREGKADGIGDGRRQIALDRIRVATLNWNFTP
jgi:hypothetical protein